VGDTVNVSMTVKNLGEWTDDFTVGMFLDDTNTTALATKPFTEMDNGGEETFNFTWDTTGASLGKHELILKADSGEIVLEQDEDNNVHKLEIWVYPPISKFKASKKDPEEGEKIKLTATVENPSDEEFNTTVVLTKDDEELETQTVTIEAGGSEEVTFKWKASKEGKHIFKVHLLGSEENLLEVKVDVKTASPGPGLIMALLAVGLVAVVAASARRRRA
jgi:subtilase family serine protease